MHAQPDLTLVSIHTAVVEDRTRLEGVEKAVAEINRKLDTLTRWAIGAVVSFSGSLLLFVLKLLAHQ